MKKFTTTDTRFGDFLMCMCGLQKMYHKSEPAYFGGERFGAFASVANRTNGCLGFDEDNSVTTFERAFEVATFHGGKGQPPCWRIGSK